MQTNIQNLHEQKILLLDKVLARGKKHQAVNGAERFNINLAGELVAYGAKLSVVAATNWKADLDKIIGEDKFTQISLPTWFRVAWPNVLLSVALLFRKRFDVLLLGNVGRNTLPTVFILYWLSCFKKCVLFAHREPTKGFLLFAKHLPLTVVAVNKQIAQHFLDAGIENVDVYFGEINSEAFLKTKPHSNSDGIVNFAVFGSLDCEWKGSDTAIEAFEKLPLEIQQKSRLHLASFDKNPPKTSNPSIKVYSWMEEKEVPSFLSQIDILVVPSRDTNIMKETFSQAMVQGMLCELPLIVNDLPILTEKVSKGGGLVFRDTNELTAHMKYLFENEIERKKIAKLAKETALSDYCWDTQVFTERYLQA